MGDEAAPEFQYRIQLALMDTSFQVRVCHECCGQCAMRGGGSMCVARDMLRRRCSVYYQCLLLNATRREVKYPPPAV
jgi:hypothetical protein